MIGMDVHEQHGVDLLWLVSRYPGLAMSPPMLDRSSPAPVSTRMSCEPALIKNPLLDSSMEAPDVRWRGFCGFGQV
jgi:hypothetical protein